ncbi:MAG: MFS transporter [Bacteroidota bacterium]|nr:MFS transporter [Bacteroidota bacterium]
MRNPLLVTILGISIAGITFGLVGPATVILLERSKAPSWINGLSTMMLYISVVLFSSLTGKLIDKFKVKKILLAGLVIVIIGSLGLVFWRNYFLLFIVRFILGIGSTFLFVSTEVLVNTISNDSNSSGNISLYVIFLSVGIAAGALLIWTVRIYEWLPFIIGAFLIFVVFVLESVLLKEFSSPIASPGTNRSFPFKSMPLIALASAALYGIFESSMGVVLPLYGLRNNFSEIQVSYFLASFVIGGIILFYFIGKLAAKKNKFNLLLALSFFLVPLLFLPGLLLNFYVLIIAFFVVGGIVPAFYSIGLTYTIEKIERDFIAQANGHFVMSYGLGTLIGPVAGSMLVELNRQYGYWFATMLLCLVYFLFFEFKKKKRD